jgi:short-subunit dehydrogenase
MITGAAAGIGREMAGLFGARRARLVLLDKNAEALDRVRRELTAAGIEADAEVCDLARPEAVGKTCADVQRRIGAVDILVNNAGIVVGKPLLEADLDEIRQVVAVNLIALIHLTRFWLPAMVVRAEGHIVNIASAAGLLAMPHLATYCATKFAVVGFSDALRQEMKKHGHKVKVTCVCPSVIGTGMFAGFKPPRLNPLLQPPVVAAMVVRAVVKNRPYVKTPFMVHLIPLFRMLPADLVDRIGFFLGTGRAMDSFRGRRGDTAGRE